jgi:cytochrome c
MGVYVFIHRFLFPMQLSDKAPVIDAVRPPLRERFVNRRLMFACLMLMSSGPALAAGDPKAGEALFAKTCGGCHKIGRYARAAFGPELNGIFGRPAGSTTDYVYSSAMKASGITWQRETLMAFIKEPSDVVPGTNMHFWGISDPQKLDDLLAWLRANQDAQ